MRHATPALVLLFGLAACASTPAERNLAGLSATQASAHEGTIKAFIAAQADLNTADASELDSFAAATAVDRGQADHAVEIWKLGKQQPLLDQDAVVTSTAPTTIVASLNVAATQPLALGDSGAGTALDGMVTTLKKLSTPPDAQGEFAEIVEAFSATNTALESIQKSAATAPAPKKGVTTAAGATAAKTP
jgi:hypothetical protein